MRARVSSAELTLLRRDGTVLRRIPLDSITRVEVVSALRMRKASYRPFRGSVLRLEVAEPSGLLVVGIVLRDPEPWRARISGNPVTPPS